MFVTRRPLIGKAALFGGTFDPPHVGHVAIGKLARSLLSPGEWCVVMPTSKNPLKELSGNSGSSAHRLAMTRLVFEERDGFLVSDYEIAQPPPGFTIDTVRALRNQNPD